MSNEVFQTFLFADLSGFTALTEAHGDGQAADCASRFYELAQRALTGDAKMVKKIGDAVMITTTQPMAAVSTALKLLASVQLEPDFPAVRCGVHMGHVIEREGDYYGAAVNLAARLTAFARSDQVLCTRPVAEALSDLDVKLRSCGSAQFKNVAQPVEVFAITGISQGSDIWTIDPVCRMRLELESAPARLPFQGNEYHFCSLVCAQTFMQSPEVYARQEH